MTRKQKHLLTRILVAAVLFLAGSLLHLPEYVEMGVFLVCYAVVGWDIVWKAITNILHGQVFDENFLMTIATIGALILGEHSEGVAVMLFYQVGEWFQSYAVSKSRKSIASLMDIRPDYANVEQDAKLMEKEHIKYKPSVSIGTVVYLACDGKYAGCIVIEDEVKEDAPAAIKLLKSSGIRKTVMLTGDADAVGQKVAGRLGLDQAYTELLPADKVDRVEDLLKQKSEKGKLVFVGDGINDAPVLARADVGIAMGGLGSDAAIEAADVVLMTDEPSKIAAVMKIARKTIGIANQNIVFALGVKFLVLVLGALGYANMWAAVFADVGVSVIAILNAIRAMRVKQPNMTA